MAKPLLQRVKSSLSRWNEVKSIWCRIHVHKYKGKSIRVNDNYRTGKYVGDVEITEKRHYFSRKCIRNNCNHARTSPWIWD